MNFASGSTSLSWLSSQGTSFRSLSTVQSLQVSQRLRSSESSSQSQLVCQQLSISILRQNRQAKAKKESCRYKSWNRARENSYVMHHKLSHPSRIQPRTSLLGWEKLAGVSPALRQFKLQIFHLFSISDWLNSFGLLLAGSSSDDHQRSRGSSHRSDSFWSFFLVLRCWVLNSHS